jgi:hypothetical protein
LIDDPAVGTTISAFGFDEQIHADYGILSADPATGSTSS